MSGSRCPSWRSCCWPGLQRVPQSLYRAAYMDGASPWQSFLYVTLPTMRGVIAIAIVLQTIWSLRVFDLVFVLTRGGPADATVLLNFLAYRVTFNFLDLGYGAAIANVIFAPTFLLAILYVWLLWPREPRARDELRQASAWQAALRQAVHRSGLRSSCCGRRRPFSGWSCRACWNSRR